MRPPFGFVGYLSPRSGAAVGIGREGNFVFWLSGQYMNRDEDIACGLPPGYLLVATLELFHIRFLGCPSVEKEGSLSVLGVLFLQINEKYVGAL